ADCGRAATGDEYRGGAVAGQVGARKREHGGVRVDRDDARNTEPGGRERQDPGPGADVERRANAAALDRRLDRLEAGARGRVLTRAERHARVDDEDLAVGDDGDVPRRRDEEPTTDD